jgi:6-phosphogluconolactonase
MNSTKFESNGPVALALILLAACSGGGGPPPKYAVSGVVSGLSGSGLVLLDNGGDDLTIKNNGSFAFATKISSGAAYAVTVKTQPTSPSQSCEVGNGSGTVGSGTVSTVTISCKTLGYTVGGSVSGLKGSGLVLGNNGAGFLPITSGGAFVFATPVATGGAYSVTVVTQPSNPVQNCLVMNGSKSGTVSAVNVITVAVVCANVGKFAYLTSASDPTISAYAINPVTGAPTAIVGSPFATNQGGGGTAIAVDPTAKFLYTVGVVANGIGGQSIDMETGALTPLIGSPFFAGGLSFDTLCIDPRGHFLFATEDIGLISAFAFDETTGALTAVAGSPYGTPFVHPIGVTVDPSGRFLYLGNSVLTYTIDTTTGALTMLPNQVLGNGVLLPTVDARGKFLYGAFVDSVSAYTLNADTGALTAVAGSPFAAGKGAYAVTSDPSGTFLYVVNQENVAGANSVSAYTINPDSGALTAVAGSPFPTGAESTGVMTDPSGKFLYVPNTADNTISAFAIDADTGALEPVKGSPFAAGHSPNWIAIIN